MLTWNLIGKVIDIETAFQHGNLKETIFMEIPKGKEANKDECLILKRTIYGLVQSAREFYNKLVLSLKGCGFKGSPVDLTDYLNCNIQINQETMTTFVMQPYLINRLNQKFEDKMMTPRCTQNIDQESACCCT